MYDANPAFKHRDQHVWVEHSPFTVEQKWARDDRPYIYEVTPQEAPQPYNGQAAEGWVTPGATVAREITRNGWLPEDFKEQEWAKNRRTVAGSVSLFADPDGRGVWKTAADGSVEFLAAPHAR
jgi:hypothetical protein